MKRNNRTINWKTKFNELPINKQVQIKKRLKQGEGVYPIMEEFHILPSSLLLEVEDMQKLKSSMCLGNKDEAYNTEEEMILGFRCSYNDLSPAEKNIYNLI